MPDSYNQYCCFIRWGSTLLNPTCRGYQHKNYCLYTGKTDDRALIFLITVVLEEALSIVAFPYTSQRKK